MSTAFVDLKLEGGSNRTPRELQAQEIGKVELLYSVNLFFSKLNPDILDR